MQHFRRQFPMIGAERSKMLPWIRFDLTKGQQFFSAVWRHLKKFGKYIRVFRPCGALAWRRVKVETSIDEGRIMFASALYGELSKVSRQQISDAHLGVRNRGTRFLHIYTWNASTICFHQKTRETKRTRMQSCKALLRNTYFSTVLYVFPFFPCYRTSAL